MVMPTYNRVELLPRAIDSILAQTMKDFEFIIVDDGSTDNTAQLLQEYQQKDSRIKVITLPQNKGVSTARQIGNQAARGKYITIMDSDDIAFSLFLEKSVSFLEKNPNTTILKPQGGMHSNGTNPYKASFLYNFPIHQIIFASRLGNVGITFRRDFIKKNKIAYNPTFKCAEDYDFWIKMIKKGATIAYLENNNKPLYSTRYHNTTVYTDCGPNSQTVFNGLMDFLNVPAKKRKDKCFIFKKAIQFNPSLFNKKTINDGVQAYCPPQDTFYIQINHSNWSDYLIFSKDKKRVSRYKKPTEQASVISFTPQKEITIKWDNWGKEIFEYRQKNTYQLKQEFK